MTEPTGSLSNITVAVRPAEEGYAVTFNDRAAKTPGRHDIVVPSAALAEAVADEVRALLADDPAILTGKGFGDPAMAPNFRIAAGAIDVIAHKPGAREDICADLAGYGATDLVCFRAETPDALVEAEAAAWDPLLAWFAAEFGAALAVTTALNAVNQDKAATDAIRAAVADHDDFALAALSLAVRAAGSVVIGLALSRGHLDAEAAFAASSVDESFQAARWGADAEAEQARAGKALDLAQAERFLVLLRQGAPAS